MARRRWPTIVLTPVSAKVIRQSSMSVLQELERSAAVAHHEVVRDRLVVVEEVRLHDVRAVPEAEDEVLVAEVGVVPHDVPQDRPDADRDHRLRGYVGVLAQPQPEAPGEQHDLHGRPLQLSRLQFGARNAGSVVDDGADCHRRLSVRCAPAPAPAALGALRCTGGRSWTVPSTTWGSRDGGRTRQARGPDDLHRDEARGCFRHRPRAPRGRPRLLRADVLPARVRGARPRAGDRAGERRVQPASGHAPRHALPVPACRRDQAGSVPRAARSSTSSSTSARRARRISSTSRSS